MLRKLFDSILLAGLGLASTMLLALMLLGLLLMGLSCHTKVRSAPAPLRRPLVPRSVQYLSVSDLIGNHAVNWGGSAGWLATLGPDGSWFCASFGGSCYAGWWRLNETCDLLITEAPINEDGGLGQIATYKVEWKKNKRGRLTPGSLSGSLLRDGCAPSQFEMKRIKEKKK